MDNYIMNKKEELYNPKQKKKDDDFIGFTFNGKSSSSFNIYRVSGNNRYDEGILPAMEDKTVQTPGNDGVFFFGSYYTQKPLQIDIAFDSITEENFRQLRIWLGDKKPHDLIFHEAPYKIYKAKVSNPPTLSYICFNEIDENGKEYRIYRGEGSINFTCYYPFAICDKKELEQYNYLNNVDEWSAASGILSSSEMIKYNRLDNILGDNKSPYQKILVYNPGDLDTDFILEFNTPPQLSKEKILEDNQNNNSFDYDLINDDCYLQIIISNNNDNHLELKIPLLVEYEKDKFNTQGTFKIRYNSKLHLIEGINNNGHLNNKVYNNLILHGLDTGDFFKIPNNGESELNIEANIISNNLFPSNEINYNAADYLTNKIEYNYLYY